MKECLKAQGVLNTKNISVLFMKLLNIMLSRDLGGIQQAFLDYSQALRSMGHEVIEVTSYASQINPKVSSSDNVRLLNLGTWDPVSPRKIRKTIIKHEAEAVIAHGNRAIKFALKAKKSGAIDLPLIGVAHNYNLKYIKKCDYIFSITSHLKNYLTAHGVAKQKIFLIPNMIDNSGYEYVAPRLNNNEPIIIGAKARLVKKKGVEILLQSLSRIKRKGIKFKAVIAGDGPELHNLKKHTIQMGLSNHVKFLGWVHDKQAFFNSIDILCVPSLHEPFGIIILEGMLHSKPIVSTMSEGPSEILTHQQNALMCSVGSNQELSEQLIELANDASLRKQLSKEAFDTVCTKYNTSSIANKLDVTLPKILKDYM